MNKEIQRLLAGFKRFHEKYFLEEGAEHSMYHKLTSRGQTPKTMLIGCADSRVDPAILTDAAPGEIFIVRNVANLVPPCEPSAVGFHGTSSAVEFAVVNLKVENIIILGHRQCGGIRALMQGHTEGAEPTFVEQWMSIAEEARDNVLAKYPKANEETQCRHAEMESMKVSLKNIHTFPFVKDAVDQGRLNIMAIYFDLEQGELWEYHVGATEFRQLHL